MAKPPEPLHEMLPRASLVVDASVREVLSTGAPLAPPADKPATWSDKGTMNSEQVLVLDVARVLKGAHAGGTVTVTKPVAPYAVKAGTKGAWLLEAVAGGFVVLGRYGPDTWALAQVEEALKAALKSP